MLHLISDMLSSRFPRVEYGIGVRGQDWKYSSRTFGIKVILTASMIEMYALREGEERPQNTHSYEMTANSG